MYILVVVSSVAAHYDLYLRGFYYPWTDLVRFEWMVH
jgi:hypothetical protein